MGFGAFQSALAITKLLQLQKQGVQEFTPGAPLMKAYGRAVDMANAGFTPQETAAFIDNLYKNNATQYRLAVGRSGGSFAGQVQGGIDYGNVSAFGTFATNDAMLHRKNIGIENALAGELQNIQDKNTQAKISAHMAEQNAWGQALSAGINNVFMGAATVNPKPYKDPATPGVYDRYKKQATVDGAIDAPFNIKTSYPIDMNYDPNSNIWTT